jgi:hypothetical protein
MMDYIAGLMARGLISPDVAQGLAQKVVDLKKQMPFEGGGGAATNNVYTPRGYGEPIDSSKMQWIPRKDLDQGQNYNPQIVPDEPIVDRAPPGKPGSSKYYLQRKNFRLENDR